MTENNNRAVITGLGMICAIGNSVDEAWNNAINSVSGIHKTTTLDTTDLSLIHISEPTRP